MTSELYEVSERARLTNRLRRLRKQESLRTLMRETRLSNSDFMYPIFVDQRLSIREEIPSMPGIYRFSMSELNKEIAEVASLMIPAVLLFGLPKHKDGLGSEAYASDGIVQQAVRAIKKSAPQLVVATDVCLCQYTDHGHCGVIRDGRVENDETLELLSRIAVSHAEAGADIVGPSAMMDGQVQAIRLALDSRGLQETAIMAYSAKFASAFYGPFREAAESSPLWGDRRSYQMDPPNRREAMREIEMDIREGADIVMVKPALSYLDVIRDARNRFRLPLAAYNVSGEYAMIKAAGQKGWLDDKRVALEILTAIKRAGANIIITYFAKDAAKWLREAN
ncbi:MAG: porphobilinogen synthase [Candidatus Bathyarchaeia archaeon]